MQRELPTLLQFPSNTSVLKKISNILRVSSKLIVKHRNAVRVVRCRLSASCNIMKLRVSSEATTATGGQRANVRTAIRMRPVLRLDQARPMVGTYPFRAIAGSRKGRRVSSSIESPSRRDDRMTDHPFPQAVFTRVLCIWEHGPRE